MINVLTRRFPKDRKFNFIHGNEKKELDRNHRNPDIFSSYNYLPVFGVSLSVSL
jgi:hypothetical protein